MTLIIVSSASDTAIELTFDIIPATNGATSIFAINYLNSVDLATSLALYNSMKDTPSVEGSYYDAECCCC